MSDFDKIARVNALKAEAEQAFKANNFSVAIKKYTELVKDLGVLDEEVKLNLAHALYQSKDTTSKTYYNELINSPNPYIASVANQQLGNLKMQAKNLESYKESLAYFKNAIKADPKNEMARHNYEIVKKIIDKLNQEKQKQDQDKKNDQKDQDKQDQKDQKQDQKDKQKQDQQKEQDKKEQEKKDQQQKEKEKNGEQPKDQKKDGKKDEQKNGEQQKKEGKDGKKEKGEDGDETEDKERKKEEQKKEATETRSKRLQEVNISPEQAKMILDAMKNNEVQYLQQNRKKAVTRPDKGKPDW